MNDKPVKPIPADPVVPEGKDAVDNLTIGELDTASRKLGVSVERAISEDVDGLKWRGLALVGWLWHRRTDRAAELDSWLALELDELIAALRLNEDDDAEEVEEDDDPTDSERASS
jgi:hypothetical protein